MSDDAYQRLVAIAGDLEAALAAEDDPWAGSPFGWIKRRPSRSVGAIGERLVEGLVRAEGWRVDRSPDSEADRLVEGHRVEIKLSTRWKAGHYRFQQIRNQDYAVLFALGISPDAAHAWVLPKEVLMDAWLTGRISSQHGGSTGSDTAWLAFPADDPPAWLSPYGGTLAAALRVLRAWLEAHP